MIRVIRVIRVIKVISERAGWKPASERVRAIRWCAANYDAALLFDDGSNSLWVR